MRCGRRIALSVLALVIATVTAMGQATAGKKSPGALGDLTAIDATKGVLTIKLASGSEAHAAVTASTAFLLIEPGKTTLEGAEKITLADVRVGDRVWARGDAAPDGTVAARQIVVMSASAIAERNRRDAEDWNARGVFGEVKSLDEATHGLTVETYRGETIAVTTTNATALLHVPAGSTRLDDAQPVAFADIKTGNQIAMRGDRSADRSQLAAETILTGDFPKPLRGRVTSVDVKQRIATIADRTGAAITLSIPDTALIRKLAPPAAGATPPPGGQNGAAGAPAGAGPRGPRGFAFALGDRAELERRTTPLTLSDVKPGDFVFAIVEPATDSAHEKARVVVKFEIPADRTRSQNPSIGDAGMGDLPF